jgi:hypothetical protein
LFLGQVACYVGGERSLVGPLKHLEADREWSGGCGAAACELLDGPALCEVVLRAVMPFAEAHDSRARHSFPELWLADALGASDGVKR